MAQDNTYTLARMKEFILKLNEDQLKQPVHISFEDCPVQDLWGHELVRTDIYVNLSDEEDCGTLEELRSTHGPEFNESDYKVATPKGTIFFF